MPDEYDDAPDGDEESSVIRELRQKAKKADDLDTEVKALRMENALAKAGMIDLSEAKRKALLAAHDGDLEVGALRKTAVDLGFISEPEPEPHVPANEVAAHQRAQEATAQAEPADAHPEKLEDLIAKTKSPEDLDALMASAGQLQPPPAED